MPLLAYIEMIDVRDLDEQIASFAIIAAASVLVSWGLIKLWSGFRFPCLVATVIASLVILGEVRSTQSWFTQEPLPLGYLISGYSSAILPPIAVSAFVFLFRKGTKAEAQQT